MGRILEVLTYFQPQKVRTHLNPEQNIKVELQEPLAFLAFAKGFKFLVT